MVILAILLLFMLLFVAIVLIFMQQPSFGKKPSGDRLKRIQASPNYKNGQFQNLSPTPSLTEGASYYGVMKEFFFGDKKMTRPPVALPSVKTNISALDPNENLLIWFGHSSYYMQIDGKRILVDPVFSGNASPLSFTTKSFPGTDIYTVEDIPEIDYLFLTHDHWDHLDYKTILRLKTKVKTVITGLGTGAHLERWGYNMNRVTEKDWNEEIVLGDGLTVYSTPARHFSGRGFKRNGALWMSFVLVTPSLKIYLGGDSGYDTHFKAIGDEYGPFDLAILEDGQYNKSWKYIHMMPEEVVKAGKDLRAKKILPVHWAKFALSTHDWNDPIKRVINEAKIKGVSLLHPMIGEIISIKEVRQQKEWWGEVL